MEYKSTAEIAKQWKISARRVCIMCQQGKIEGAFKKGRTWLIPENTEKPIDGRKSRHKVSKDYDSFKQIYEIYKKKQEKAGAKYIKQYTAKNACIDILKKVGLDCTLLKSVSSNNGSPKISSKGINQTLYAFPKESEAFIVQLIEEHNNEAYKFIKKENFPFVPANVYKKLYKNIKECLKNLDCDDEVIEYELQKIDFKTDCTFLMAQHSLAAMLEDMYDLLIGCTDDSVLSLDDRKALFAYFGLCFNCFVDYFYPFPDCDSDFQAQLADYQKQLVASHEAKNEPQNDGKFTTFSDIYDNIQIQLKGSSLDSLMARKKFSEILKALGINTKLLKSNNGGVYKIPKNSIEFVDTVVKNHRHLRKISDVPFATLLELRQKIIVYLRALGCTEDIIQEQLNNLDEAVAISMHNKEFLKNIFDMFTIRGEEIHADPSTKHKEKYCYFSELSEHIDSLTNSLKYVNSEYRRIQNDEKNLQHTPYSVLQEIILKRINKKELCFNLLRECVNDLPLTGKLNNV